MTKHVLKAEKRELFGKKLNALRKKGIFPANIFGKGIDSVSIQVSQKDFEKNFKEAGETGLVYISIEGEDKERPTLLSNIQYDAITGRKLHADYKQVNLKEKATAFVPVEVEGELDIVKSGAAVISVFVNEVEVEALPTNIPEKFIVSIETLKAIGDQIKVSDLVLPDGVEIKTDLDQVVVGLSEPQKEEEVVAAATTETEAKVESAEASTQTEEKKD